MAGPITLIFGATGGVGSFVVPVVHEKGAKVVLAVRDLQKPIPGLSADEEKAAGFERVQADLEKPDSVATAVHQTGAKRAFIYALLRSPGLMRASLEALKGAGVEFVVLLSSAGIRGDARDVQPDQILPYAHAQAELALEDVFGPQGYVAVRPGFFASNLFWWRDTVKQGHVEVVYPEVRMDYIAPRDIGRVCGSILVEGLKATGGSNVVPLLGLEAIAGGDAIKMIAAAIGKTVEITPLHDQAAMEWMVQERGLPEPAARYLIDSFKTRAAQAAGGGPDEFTVGLGADTVFKYTGRPAIDLKTWIEENKHQFGG